MHHLQKTPILIQCQAPLRDQHQHFDPALVCPRGRFVKALIPRQARILASLPELKRRGSLGTDLKLRLTGTGHHASAQSPDGHIGGTNLCADFFGGQTGVRFARFCQVGGCGFGLFGQVLAQGIQSGPSQVQAGHQRGFDLDVEPAFNRARHKLVGHHINQHARHHAHQGKDTRQLDK